MYYVLATMLSNEFFIANHNVMHIKVETHQSTSDSHEKDLIRWSPKISRPAK